MTKIISNLIFLDKLFSPVYMLCSWLAPFFLSKPTGNEKNIAIKFFGMGSIVRMVNVINNTEQLELITLSKNKGICELLGIKAHYVRSENLFLLPVDLIKVLLQVWRMKKAKIIDLERTSNLSGVFRLMCSLGKSCASFTFEKKNSVHRNQTFISLENKPAIQAIAEIFEVESNKTLLVREVEYGNTIVVNVNAGEYLPQRKYPIKYFATMIESLHKLDRSFEFVLTGSAKEVEYTNRLAEQLDIFEIPYQNTAGELSLIGFVNLLKGSRLLITNDSGPLHLAQYVKVPTVAIWGPTSAKLVGYPDSVIMKNISIEKTCSPCFIHPKSRVAEVCSNRIDCLQELDPKIVVEEVLLLSQSLNLVASVR